MRPAIVLDTTPLSLLTQRKGVPQADACRQWFAALRGAGRQVLVAEIADYEVRRELLRANKTAGLRRLDEFLASRPSSYLALTTSAMRLAADLWARARQAGQPTASDDALDGDAILAAQALSALPIPGSVVVATANPGHLSRFVSAELWEKINP